MNELINAVAGWPHHLVLGVQFAVLLVALVAAAAIGAARPYAAHASGRGQVWRIGAPIMLMIACLLGLATMFVGSAMLWRHGYGLKVVGVGVGFFIVGWMAIRPPDNSSDQ